MSTRFLEVVSQFMRLSPDSQAALSGVLQHMERPRGHVLLKQDTVCQYIYFVEKGLTRTYYLKDGKDVTDWFSPEDSFAVSIVSFLTRKPDIRIIELLEPSVLWALPHSGLESLYNEHHEIERLGRLLVSSGVVQLQMRFDDLHFATAQQRYQMLLDTQPSLLQRVPLGMIASYLGITQETLSRILAQR